MSQLCRKPLNLRRLGALIVDLRLAIGNSAAALASSIGLAALRAVR